MRKLVILKILVISFFSLQTCIYSQIGEGISTAGALSSLDNCITGLILDAKTLKPIEGSNVTLSGSSQTAVSDKTGRFFMYAKPATGYSLSFSAPYYITISRSDIKFSDEGISNIGIVLLSPTRENECDVIELKPNPNPQYSTVGLNGTAKRYYQVVSKKSRLPVDGIKVTFMRQDGKAKTFISGPYEEHKGILVAVFDQQNDLGCTDCSENYSITQIDKEDISPGILGFTLKFQPREIEKVYEIAGNMEVGFGFAIGKSVTGKYGDDVYAKFILKQPDNSLMPAKLGMSMRFENSMGVDIGVGSGIKFGAGPVTGGVYGGVKTGGYVTFGSDGEYLYNYNSLNDDMEARAKLYNLCLAGLYLKPNPLLSRIAFCLGAKTPWNYLDKARTGIGIKGDASIEGLIGLFGTTSEKKNRVGFGIKGSVNASFGGKLETEYDGHDGQSFGSLKIFGTASINTGFGIYGWGYTKAGNPDFKYANKIKAKSNLAVMADLLNCSGYYKLSYGGEIPKLSLETSVSSPSSTRTFSLSYSHPDLGSMIGNSILKDLYCLSEPFDLADINPIRIGAGCLSESTDDLWGKIEYKQINEDYPGISYKVESARVVTSGGIRLLDVDLKFGLSLDLGTGIKWNTSFKAPVEKGVFLGGNEYPLETYSQVPEIDIPMSEVFTKIVLDGLKSFRLADIVSSFAIKGNTSNNISKTSLDDSLSSKIVYQISENGSKIELDPQSITQSVSSLSCNSWNWYGNSASSTYSELDESAKKLAKTIKSQQQAIAKMEYGIGGFYKFEPQGVALSSPATLTIVYPDSDAAGIDESKLAIFSLDTSSNQWKYLGGIPDPSNNRISVKVDTLQLYTIAPVMPGGEIGIRLETDTLKVGNFTSTTVETNTLFFNDGSPVGSGIKYTVSTDNLEIENPDVDPGTPGIQLLSQDSKVTFTVKCTRRSGKGEIIINSVDGLSKGETSLSIIDNTQPLPVLISRSRISGNTAALYILNPDPSKNVQFEILYGTKSLGPYLGKSINGLNDSPFVVNASDSIFVGNLFNDSTYYFAVKSMDLNGKRSVLSNEVKLSVKDTIPPAKISGIDFTVMPDSTYLARWKASGDDGKSGKAAKYTFAVSSQIPADTLAWWNAAASIIPVSIPSLSGSYDYQPLPKYVTDGFYLGIISFDEAGNRSPAGIFRVSQSRITRTLDLQTGWNLFSHPVRMEVAAKLNKIIPNISAGPYVFDPAKGYILTDTLFEEYGAWVRIPQGFKFNINGEMFKDPVINLKKGWNIIGGFSAGISLADISTEPDSLIMSPFYGFSTSGYFSTNFLIPGKGYWVKFAASGKIKIKSPGIVYNKPNEIALFGRFRITDKTRSVREVYLVNSRDEMSFIAPPKPPDDIFDARFKNDSYAVDYLKNENILLLNGAEYPIELEQFDNNSEYTVVGLTNNKNYGSIKQNVRMIIADRQESLLLKRKEIPDSYYLSQNYPNPFNPKTTIAFGIPLKGKVDMTVYNSLGQKVTVLINDQIYEAGNYRTEWNASGFSSGVYFIQLRSEGFNNVIKVLLLK